MEDEEKQDGNNFDNSKIECKSKRSINILLLKLKNYIGSYGSKPSQTENYDLEALNRKIYQVILNIPHPLDTTVCIEVYLILSEVNNFQSCRDGAIAFWVLTSTLGSQW